MCRSSHNPSDVVIVFVESPKPMCVAVRSREGRGGGASPLPRPVPYCFPGIPAENAGTMFFMSPGSPVG